MRLQDYAFTQRFALVIKENDKQCKTVLFDYLRHHKKQRNISKIKEKDRKRPNTKAFFLKFKYKILISSPLPPRPEVWTITITYAKHNHEMNPDPFCFIQNRDKNQYQDNTVLHVVQL